MWWENKHLHALLVDFLEASDWQEQNPELGGLSIYSSWAILIFLFLCFCLSAVQSSV